MSFNRFRVEMATGPADAFDDEFKVRAAAGFAERAESFRRRCLASARCAGFG
jgi:hypothetical protein